MEELAELFKALADPTRLMILALLFEKRELCVCDFEEVLRISQSKASRHLQYLKHAGFLADRRAGLWSYYRFQDHLRPDAQITLRVVRKLLDEKRVAELRDDLHRWLSGKDRGAVCNKKGKA